MIDALRTLYAPPEWAFFTEVRSSLGARVEGLRVADGLAVALWPSHGWQAHGFELKRSRNDFLRELDDPLKSATLKASCTAWWLVVPAPWKKIVLHTSEVPESWGLLEVDGRGAHVVVAAPPLEAPEPSLAFFLSIFRAATPAPGAAPAGIQAPLMAITRPRLARDRVGLACGHVAPKPLAKVLPTRIACFDCAEGRPTDPELVRAALEDAPVESLATFERALAKRRHRIA